MDATARTELIDRYLKDELTGKELALFEAQIQKEPALLREVELQRQAISAIKEAEIRNILRRTHAKIMKEEEGEISSQVPVEKFANPDHVFLKAAALNIQMPDPEEVNAFSEIGPEYLSIAYEGDSTPPFQINSFSGKDIFNGVKIHPVSGSQTFDYRLEYYSNIQPTLYLYGDFNPANLTLIYFKQEDKDIFKLRVNAIEYFLKKNEFTRPLSEQEQSE